MTKEQRDEIERKLVESSQGVARLFEDYSAAQLTHRPAAASWSAAECVVHLSLTAAASTPLIEAAVADLRARGAVTATKSRMDWLGRALRWSIEPPPRFKTPTTAPFQPQRVEPIAEVLPEFTRQQHRLIEALRSAKGLNLSGHKVTSPFNSRVRYNVYSMFRIIETHERRHLWQAKRAAAAAAAA